ncbi:GlcG/HbpS family heme-binding protein [Roseitranquillus sediminis]|uniref:GlcG/HbpS family heme-binding protein n=1 Tax=Roseitranquillus sediminis TaxID=2809051 RepID=UPI001D0C39AC|nr:heme-binding protein [Roseitranquillus sediminis]MBM9594875.1 heme-binding protein [Roseitranquillus sediminis]
MMRLTALLAALALPAAAQDDGAFVEFRALKPEVALRMAEAALEHCREQGYQAGVTVVDRSGVPQVFLRARYAGPHVFETSRRKAWTAASFRTPTSELSDATQAGEDAFGIRYLTEALPLGGGLPVDAGGSLVAAIGVSGAPSPELDDECAQAGIDAVAFEIAF